MRFNTVLCCLVFLTATGCASLMNKDVHENKGLDKVNSQSYTLKEGLDLQVTFQNRKAYDAVQLGLFMLGKTGNQEAFISIEDQDFFPRYFALVNVDIDDGILYISESEASQFARAAYLQYQDNVQSGTELKDFQQSYTLSEIICRN